MKLVTSLQSRWLSPEHTERAAAHIVEGSFTEAAGIQLDQSRTFLKRDWMTLMLLPCTALPLSCLHGDALMLMITKIHLKLTTPELRALYCSHFYKV